MGYRDLDGRFYDAQGRRTSAGAVRNVESGDVRAVRDAQGEETFRLTSDVFKDYTPRFALQPRVAFNLDVRPRTLLYGYANRLARQPIAFEPPTLQAYDRAIEGMGVLNNDLGPEKTWSLGLGARQQVGLSAAVAVTAFYRRYTDLAWLEAQTGVFPNNYNTFANTGKATARGVEVAFELQRVRGLRVRGELHVASDRRTRTSGTVRRWRL